VAAADDCEVAPDGGDADAARRAAEECARAALVADEIECDVSLGGETASGGCTAAFDPNFRP
jgi:hypothetical protein